LTKRQRVCRTGRQARSEAREWRLRRQAAELRAELDALRGQRRFFPALPSPLEQCAGALLLWITHRWLRRG